MRRSRRGGGSGVEFGSSGEDSFVAVVVTKLTGALLFILLLTMVIMALLPKVADLEERNNDRIAIGRPEEPRAAQDLDTAQAARGHRRPALPGRTRGDRRQRAAGMVGRGRIARLAHARSRNRAGSAVRRQARPKSRWSSRSGSATAPKRPRSRSQLVVLPYQIGVSPSVEASGQRSSLARLARTGRRVPGPLARAPGRNEPPGERRARIAGGSRGFREPG